MKKQILTICLSIVLVWAHFSPVPAGATHLAQVGQPQDVRVMVVIPETLNLQRPPDPAAETEMIRQLVEAGFTVLDPIAYAPFRYSDEFLRAIRDTTLAQEIGRRFGVHVIIIGEGIAETASRDGRLFSSRARVEARAIDTEDATVIDAHGEDATARDVSQTVGGKAALRNAGGKLVGHMMACIAEHFDVQPIPAEISRASTAVIRFTAPRLPPEIDFSTILSDAIVRLGTVDVLVAGQDLESLLSNAHAGVIPVPDVVLIGSAERADVVNLAVIPIPPLIFYLNRVTLRVSVRAVDTETGRILAVASRERTTKALDIVASIAGITVGIFDRTVLGRLTRAVLKELAAEITPAVLLALPQASYFDIITIRNGDRLGGSILNPHFTIVTSIGTLTIPTVEIESIVFGETTRITRRTGETLTGRIQERDLMVDPWGTIPLNQVATIVFVIKC